MIDPCEKEGAPAGAVSEAALDQLFRNARSFSHWLDRPVGDDLLRRLYELMKWGPTSANGGPGGILCRAMTKITFQRLRAGNH